MPRKKTLNNIKQSEKGYKMLFEEGRDIMVILDNKGKIIDINPAIKRISGYDPREIKGRHFSEIKFITLESKKKIAKYFRYTLSGLKTPHYEIEGKARNGQRIVAEVNSSPLSIGKKVEGSLAILRNITERKQMEEMLQEAKERFQNILAFSPDAITVTDLKGNIIECNQATLKMHGFSTKQELIGKASFGLIAKKDWPKAIKNLKKTLEKGFLKNEEYNFVTKDGREFEAELSASVIRDSAGKPVAFVAITEDITERKRMDRAKDEFISLASHQLRTPLSIMSWYAETLLFGKIGKNNDRQKRYLEEIYIANHRLIELVNLLLNVSRIDLGKFKIEEQPLNIKELANSIVREFSPHIERKKLKVKMAYEKKLPIVSADPNILRIIFENLLSNAIKYTPEGGRINLSAQKKKSEVIIKISDTGYGIPKNQQSQIFSRFFRADNIIEHDPEGIGLGLYTVKSLLEQMGSRIWFESKERNGTTFFVAFPFKKPKKKN